MSFVLCKVQDCAGRIVGTAIRAIVVGLVVLIGEEAAVAQPTVADFNGDGTDDLAIGAPGANDGQGTVSIFFGLRGIGFYRDTPDLTISGVFAGEAYGSALAAADFNQNGRSELVVGAPSANSSRGRIEVLQFTRFGAPVPTRLSFNQRSTGNVAQANARFGAALVTGNFDDDRYPDLAIGVPGDKFGAKTDMGAVEVLYGSHDGVTTARRQYWHQDADVVGVGRAYDHFGFALAAGDFDGDGWDDLAIGAPDKDVTFTNQGAVYVLYGTPTGLSPDQQQLEVSSNPSTGIQYGYALAAGDFNGDHVDDLAIGAPRASSISVNAGTVVIMVGFRSGLRFTPTSPQDSELVEVNAFTGWALAAGDFNNDGFDDLAIGAPGKYVGEDLGAGVVNVLYGQYGRVDVAFGTSQILHQDSFGVRDNAEWGDWFGASLTAGDFNGDGFADLVIGIPYEDLGNNTTPDAGAVAVLYGTPYGVTSAENRVLVAASRQTDARFGSGPSR